MTTQPDRPRTVVCGTSFGRVYLQAVHEAPDLELSGILSRGSTASHDLADSYGVPSYTDVDELPDDTDIACVVVRASVAGGAGSELSRRLLGRGVHVLQEHLLHPEELVACLRASHESKARFRVNAFYPHLAAVRRFLDAARLLRERQRPLFVDAAAGGQVLYPLIDVMGRTLGGFRPWRFADPDPVPADLEALSDTAAPYTHLHGVVGGTPVSLRVQNQIAPSDPDNHALLLHRLSVAFEGGVLTLADTHGPVLWSPRMHSERDGTGRLIMAGPGTERLAVPSTEPLGPASGPAYHDVFDQEWPGAVRTALGELRADADDSVRAAAADQWALTVTDVWHDVSGRIGPPVLLDPPTPEPVPLPDLLAERAAQTAPEGSRV
ncbi:Gfo/Idh/MocA family oxidoreductase [Nocardiopsis exhalans]|uniref:Gfo/Idh/MocA family oxidoreductase n=1 Tax=Nocardiopsis exhalans TaxID=163604 RepID=A0ABY5DGS3_9ACTN|nr:Gfo/Idh/MocA family oxidoreductase [Nocardiopsis exhalans]USY22317.1 Gfo/Idh/MocA family oxidoreductase [Nocardiopsis exhalans]